MSADPPIVAVDLQRRFGELVAVDGVDLEVSEGEIYGFLGPNGAGKSTTVRMLTTLLAPTGGHAVVAGYDVVRQPAAVRAAIGVALQDAAIDPLMTAAELLKLQAVLHGIPNKTVRQRGGELLERVGLTAAADRRVGTFSGGMRRRLDLAMSLIHEPSVLFLDEPTTGLDPTSRTALWEEVSRLNTELGATILLTTQYLEEADQLANRVGIIDHGTIVRAGTPASLKAEVGSPTLRLEVHEEAQERTAELLASYGETRPARNGRVAIGLNGGSPALADVLRTLGDAGIHVHHIQLEEPTLDDVFAEATGRRLEGSAQANATAAP